MQYKVALHQLTIQCNAVPSSALHSSSATLFIALPAARPTISPSRGAVARPSEPRHPETDGRIDEQRVDSVPASIPD